jgi:hypothetical protein
LRFRAGRVITGRAVAGGICWPGIGGRWHRNIAGRRSGTGQLPIAWLSAALHPAPFPPWLYELA